LVSNESFDYVQINTLSILITISKAIAMLHRLRQPILYAMCCIMVSNSILLPFANRSWAQEPMTPEQEANRTAILSQGQWEGAQGIQGFSLPGMDTSPSDPNAPNDFSTIKFDELFSGFSESAHNDYFTQLQGTVDEPHRIQDQLYDLNQRYLAFDENTVCEDLPTEEEQRDCDSYKISLALRDTRQNTSDDFFGANDPILASYASISDGTHPYYQELQNEECVELTTTGNDGDALDELTNMQYCTLPIDSIAAQECQVERFMESTFVAEKLIMEYDPRGSYESFNHDFPEASLTACEDSGSLPEGVSCIEVRTFETSAWNLDPYFLSEQNRFGGGNTGFRSFGITFAQDVELIDVTSTRHSILYGSAAFSNTLSDYNYVFADGFTTPFVSGSAFAAKKYAANLMPEGTLDAYPFGRSGISRFGRGECVSDNWIDDRWSGTVEFEPRGSYYRCYPPDVVDYASPLEPNTSSILGAYDISGLAPFFDNSASDDGTRYIFRKHTARTIYFDGAEAAISAITSDTSGRLHNLTSTKFYFNNIAVTGGGGGQNDTYIQNVIIDDVDDYPRQALINVMGAEIVVDVDVFDQGLYSVSQYFPTNIRVEGDSVISWELVSIGRPTDRYNYQLVLELDRLAPFQVYADLHEITEQGFRPISGEDPACVRLLEHFVANTYPVEARCDYLIDQDNSRITQSNVLIDQPHIGYFQFLAEWGQNGNPPLSNFCYDATISFDVTELGFSDLDPGIACAGLLGDDYDNCLRGEYCTDNILAGGQTCVSIDNGINRDFNRACSTLIADENCTYVPEETNCEEFIEVDGLTRCIFESHAFSCSRGTSGYSYPGDRDRTEINCGSPRDCFNGECTAVEEESNTAFVRALALQGIAEEASESDCSAVPVASNGTIPDAQQGNCRLFNGESGHCDQPKVFGAMDCCSPSDMGLGGRDIEAIWASYRTLSRVTEQITGQSIGAHAWGLIDETTVGQSLGSASNYISQQADDATNFIIDNTSDTLSSVTKPIVEGWESAMSTLGISPSTAALNAGPAVAKETVTGALNTMQASGANVVNAAPDPSALVDAAASAGAGAVTPLLPDSAEALEGVAKYVAKGVNAVLKTISEDFAGDLFVEGALEEGSGEALEIAFNPNTPLGQAAQQIFNVFSTIMLAYQIYQAYTLFVNIVFACDVPSVQTVQKIDLLQNVYVKSYCESDSFLGCIVYRQMHCTYGSVFNRILAEQLRGYFNRIDSTNPNGLWNTADFNPTAIISEINCQGFTTAELESVDWDQIDLSEYEQIMLRLMKYDPNNMPEDFVKSDYLSGDRTGEQAGTTFTQDATAQATIAATAGDFRRMNNTDHSTVLDNPDFMPWYTGTTGDSANLCRLQCDYSGGYVLNSVSGLCHKQEYSPVGSIYTCNTADGYALVSNSDGDLICEQVIVTPIQTGCRDGYEFNTVTSICEQENLLYAAPESVCPLSYTLDEELQLCVLTQSVAQVLGCEAYGPAFSLVDGACQQTATEIEPAILNCPNDHELIDGVCVRTVEQSLIITCEAPLQYDLVTESCVEVSVASVPVVRDCSSYGTGYQLSGDSCVYTETSVANIVCDTSAGYALVDGFCTRTIEAEYPPNEFCPDGFMLSDDRTTCFQYVQEPRLATPFCADSTFTLIGDAYCEKTVVETLPSIPQCNSGFSYNATSSFCERQDSYSATIDCPVGYDYNVALSICENTSTETVAPSFVCVLPYIYNSTSLLCENTTSVGFSYECPANFELSVDGTICERVDVVTQAPITLCPDGQTVVGNQCQETIIVEPIITCPVSAVINAETGFCEETMVITQPPSSMCIFPSVRIEDDTCINRITEPAVITCPLDAINPWVYNVDSRQCTRTVLTVTDSTVLCAPGSPEFLAGECTNVILREPTWQCSAGALNPISGLCETFSYNYPPATPICDTANGFVFDSILLMCVQAIDEVSFGCGPDHSFNLVSGQCELLAVLTALPDCPNGYAFDSVVCRRTVHTPMVCDDPSLSYNPSTLRCETLRSGLPITECLLPYVVDTADPTQCKLHYSYAPACENAPFPAVFNPSTDRCEFVSEVATHAAQPSCSAGYLLVDNQCTRSLTSAPSCPTGMTFNASLDTCVRAPLPTSLYCSQGTLVNELGVDYCRKVELSQPLCSDPINQYYEIALNQCIDKDLVFGTIDCNLGPFPMSELENNACHNYYVEPYVIPDVCPDSYLPFTTESCRLKVSITPPLFRCPDGYSQPFDVNGIRLIDSPYCLIEPAVPPVCGPDYALINNYCERTVDTLPLERCLQGGVYLFGSQCDATVQNAPTCTIGYHYSADDNVCVSITTAPVIFSCYNSTNFALQPDLTCLSTYSQPPICDSDFTFNPSTNACESNAFGADCPTGFTFDAILERCRLTEMQVAAQSCPSGHRYQTGVGCIEQRTVTSANCQSTYGSGFYFNEVQNRCQRDQAYDITCPAGFDAIGGGLCVQVENPTYICANGGIFQDNGVTPSIDQCEQVFTQPYDQCLPGQTFFDGACRDSGAPQCLAGSTVNPSNPDECLEVNQVDDTPQCLGGFTYNSTIDACSRDSNLGPADQYCTGGSVLQPDGTCETVTTQPYDLCGVGQQFVDGACRNLGTSQCPVGTTVNPSNPDVCLDSNQVDDTPQCLGGYTYSPAADQCTRDSIIGPADQYCTGGGVLQPDGTCEIVTTQPYDLCAVGQQFVDGACRSTNAPQCPSGFVIDPTNEDRCVNTVSADDPPVCTGGYSYNTALNACTRDSLSGPADRFCAVDEDPGAADCQISSPISDGNIVCPSGEFYDATTQSCQEYVFGTASCPSGESYISGQCQEIITPTCSMHAGLAGNATTNSTTGACQSYRNISFNSDRLPVYAIINTYEAQGYTCLFFAEDTMPFTYGGECSYVQPFSETCRASVGTVTAPLQCSSVTGSIRDVCDDAGYDFISDNVCRGTSASGSPPTCTSLDQNGVPFVFAGGQCNGSEEITVPPTGAYHCDNYPGNQYVSGTQCYLTDGDVSAQDPCAGSLGNLTNDRCRISAITYSPIECSNNVSFTYNSSLNICLSNAGFPYAECSLPFVSNGSVCERVEYVPPAGAYHCDNYVGNVYLVGNQCYLTDGDVSAQDPCAGSLGSLTNDRCQTTTVTTTPIGCSDNVNFNYRTDLDVCISNAGFPYSECSAPFIINGGACQRVDYTQPDGAYHCDNYAAGAYVNGTQCYFPGGEVSAQDPCASSVGNLVNDRCQTETVTSVPIACADNVNFTYRASLDTCLSNTGFPYSECTAPFVGNGSACQRSEFEAPSCAIAGSTYSDARNRCEYNLQAESPADCPAGYVDNNGRCERYQNVLPCDSGFNYSSGQSRCEASVPIDFLYDCNSPAPTSYGSFVFDFVSPTYNTGDSRSCERTILVVGGCVSQPGFALVGELCQPQVFNSQQIDCQGQFGAQYVNVAGQCQYLEVGELSCASGLGEPIFANNGLRCQNFNNIPSTLSCIGGMNLIGSQCTINYQIPPEVQCESPERWDIISGRCSIENYSDPEYACALGELMDDTFTCRKTSSVVNGVPDLVCEDVGFFLNECELNTDSIVTEFCPSNLYELVPLETPVEGREYFCQLTQEENIEPISDCSTGFLLSETGVCYQDISVPPDYGCTSGFILSGDGSVCTNTVVQVVEPLYTCNAPYTLNYLNQCMSVTMTNAVLLCGDAATEFDPVPEGWLFINGLCIQTTVVDTALLIEVCNGTVVDGVCQGISSTPAIPECDTVSGFVYFAGQCIRNVVSTASPLSITCDVLPAEYTLDGVSCVRIQQQAPLGIGCEFGFVFDSALNVCSRTITYQEEPVLCAASFEQRFRKCYSQQLEPVLFGCPSFAPPNGSGVCVNTIIEYGTPVYTCSDPTFESVGSQCIRTTIEEAIVACQGGVPYTIIGDFCYQDVIQSSIPPTVACPINYNRVGDVCIFESSITPVHICRDSSWSFNSTTLNCERDDNTVLRPTSSCPIATSGNPWEASSNNTCTRITNTQPIILDCGAATMMNGQCESTELLTHAPNYCLAPPLLEGGSCRTYQYQRPVLSCPAGPDIVVRGDSCAQSSIATQLPTNSCD
jgi:hypothetical protein